MSNNFYDRSVVLTGALSPPVVINTSHFLRTTDYSVKMTAEINNNHMFMQGGPGKAVSEFKNKIIQGGFSAPIRIDESNNFPSSITEIINSAIDFQTTISLQTLTNPYNPNIIAENNPYLQPNNSLIFDTCVIETMTLSIKKEGSSKISVKIKGMVDDSNTTELTIPPDDTNLYRNLTWYDCLFYRSGSQLENAEEIEISIVKEIDERYFLMHFSDGLRYDSPYSIGVKSVTATFKIIEYITSAFDIFNFSIGGVYDDFNLSGNVGGLSFLIPDAIIQVSIEDTTGDIIKRTTEGYYKMPPNAPYDQNFVFSVA